MYWIQKMLVIALLLFSPSVGSVKFTADAQTRCSIPVEISDSAPLVTNIAVPDYKNVAIVTSKGAAKSVRAQEVIMSTKHYDPIVQSSEIALKKLNKISSEILIIKSNNILSDKPLILSNVQIVVDGAINVGKC